MLGYVTPLRLIRFRVNAVFGKEDAYAKGLHGVFGEQHVRQLRSGL